LTVRPARVTWRVIGALPLAFPLLPWPDWSGAPDTGPLWAPQFSSWGLGALVTAVAALGVGRLLVGKRPLRIPWLRGLRPVWYVGTLAMLATCACAAIAVAVFQRNPHNPDEMAQLLHVRALSTGALALQVPDVPAAFLIMQTWITDAGWVSERDAELPVGYAGWDMWRYAPDPADPDGPPHCVACRVPA
jgi:hypothetical protein